MVKAAFFDRDGVINVDHAYVHKQEEFVWIPGILSAAATLHNAGYLLVVVTNQSGIARGMYSENDFSSLTQWMEEQFAEAGAPIAHTYFCPHHPDGIVPRYRTSCTCRKPQPGMILQAAEDFDIDLSQSILFGDSPRDIEAALAAGIAHRILVGKDGKAPPAPTPECTGVSASVFTALPLVLSL